MLKDDASTLIGGFLVTTGIFPEILLCLSADCFDPDVAELADARFGIPAFRPTVQSAQLVSLGERRSGPFLAYAGCRRRYDSGRYSLLLGLRH